jgi:cell division protein FtsI (penicillin-binding protein 3)
MASNIKNEVLIRMYILLFLFVAAAVFIFAKAIRISVFDGEKWREEGKALIKLRPVEAERGNILTEDGQFLATSIPVFDISFDPNSSGMKDGDFEANVDSLAYLLSTYVDNSFTPGGYKDYLTTMRNEKKQYVKIKLGASYAEKEMMSRFPLFRKGQFKGGFVVQQKYRRERPFGLLARRTIGYVREDLPPVGLEGSFDYALRGEQGEQLMILVDEKSELWIPVSNYEAIEPKRGDDIVTTLDMELQDITEKALLRAMNYHNAEWGTVVVMEVKTGKMRAIANLGRTDEGWWETYNYAIGQPIEPGSTFKLATIMALLEDKVVSLEDSINLNKGRMEIYGKMVVDSYAHGIEKSTVRKAFEISSNVGMASLVHQHYNQTRDEKGNAVKKANQFVDKLKQFKLHLPTGIKIEGEAKPYIKTPYSTQDEWSGLTLPWMSFGYEVMLTPLQILTFYNAVANDGVLMKPYVVSEIQHMGKVKETFKPVIIDQAIASKSTIKKAQLLLEGVVENGTAKKISTDDYRFAGKTGTAQVDYQRLKNRTQISGYQASFVGYFPAEDPLYSCIVVINRPREHGFYGADVAGPVFREIADKTFASKIDLHKSINEMATENKHYKLPSRSVGEKNDMVYLVKHFGLPTYGAAGSDWVMLQATASDSIKVITRKMEAREVPNVIGMGLRDALYALENRGLAVEIVGVGKVVQQSIKAGTKLGNYKNIRLELR